MSTAARRWAPWVLLLVVAAVGLGFGLQTGSGRPSVDAQVQHIASQVRCPVCNGETVAESQAAPSVAIRNEIRADVQRGESQGQILGSLVDSYGPGILEKPQATGIGVLVWVLPVVAVVLGAGAVALVVTRWRARGRHQPSLLAAASSPGPTVATGTGDRAETRAGAVAVAVGAPAAPSVESAAGLGSPGGGAGAGAAAGAVPAGTGGAAGKIEPADAAPGTGGAGGSATPATTSGPAATSGPAGGGRRRKVLALGAGAAVVAAGISYAVVAMSGTRLPGQAITGQALGSEQVTADLQAALDAESRNDLVSALKDYQKILNAQPDQVQALTGKGWVLAQTGEPALLQQGIGLLTSAEKADPTYAPAHIYRGLALLGEGNYSDSIPDLQWYLAHDPDPKLKPGVEKALAEAQKSAAAATGTPTPGSSAPTTGSAPGG